MNYISVSFFLFSNQPYNEGIRNSVRKVEVIRPPTTTVANGFWISDPVPVEYNMGIRLKTAMEAVISTEIGRAHV